MTYWELFLSDSFLSNFVTPECPVFVRLLPLLLLPVMSPCVIVAH